MDLEKLKSKFIFIYYSPGAFGSSLYHFLMYSPDFVKYNDVTCEVFDIHGQAHNNVFKVIDNLHKGYELTNWSRLSESEKINFIQTNLNPNILDSQLYQPPIRITDYENLVEMKRFFDTSKHVIVTFKRESIDMLIELVVDKIVPNSGLEFSPKQKLIYEKAKTEKNKHAVIVESYRQRLTDWWYDKLMDFEITEDDYVFPFESFFDRELFLQDFGILIKRLGLTINFDDVESFYDKFSQNNKKYFDNWQKINGSNRVKLI